MESICVKLSTITHKVQLQLPNRFVQQTLVSSFWPLPLFQEVLSREEIKTKSSLSVLFHLYQNDNRAHPIDLF